MFSNLRQNSTIYILHKDGKPYIETGSVTAVSAPRPKYPIPGAIGQIPQVETLRCHRPHKRTVRDIAGSPGSGGHRGQPLGRQCGGLCIKRGH